MKYAPYPVLSSRRSRPAPHAHETCDLPNFTRCMEVRFEYILFSARLEHPSFRSSNPLRSSMPSPLVPRLDVEVAPETSEKSAIDVYVKDCASSPLEQPELNTVTSDVLAERIDPRVSVLNWLEMFSFHSHFDAFQHWSRWYRRWLSTLATLLVAVA